MSSAPFLLLTISLLTIVHFNFIQSANILVIFPHTGKSHFLNAQPYLFELTKRGHNLTVISHFPLNSDEKFAHPNYHDISLEGSIVLDTNNVSFSHFENPLFQYVSRTLRNLMGLYIMSTRATEAAFNVEELNQFINTTLNKGHTFDMVITESFIQDVFLGLIYKMNVPFISLTTCQLFPWSSDRIGMPQNPSYIPTNIDDFDDRMTLVERVKNTISLILSEIIYHLIFVPNEQRIAFDKFGYDIPPLGEIAKNTSLMLANLHFSLNLPRPNVPQLIEIGGIHIQPAKSLTKDLETFLNQSTHGVIYFCMGSLLRGESFPTEKRQAFLDAFAELSQNILWKYEGSSLPGQTKNVKILPWTPQRDILAHPNVKLFITHGGLLGTTEAVYEGVPMLGIPIFGDQNINMKAVASHGAGLILDYNKDLTKEKILKTIRTLLKPEYARNAKRLQGHYRDRPMTAMETAIYWTEYVLRHNGAHHLRTSAVHLPWYQYICLDVAAILLTSLLVLLYISKLFIQIMFTRIFSTQNYKGKSKVD